MGLILLITWIEIVAFTEKEREKHHFSLRTGKPWKAISENLQEEVLSSTPLCFLTEPALPVGNHCEQMQGRQKGQSEPWGSYLGYHIPEVLDVQGEPSSQQEHKNASSSFFIWGKRKNLLPVLLWVFRGHLSLGTPEFCMTITKISVWCEHPALSMVVGSRTLPAHTPWVLRMVLSPAL